MGYCSVLKRYEILSSATTKMNLEDVTLSDISQAQEGKYHMISLTWISSKQNSLKQRRRMDTRGCRAGEGGNRSW